MKLYSNVTTIFFIWVGVVLTIIFFGFLYFPHSGVFSNNFFDSFKNWDGGHYIGIAEKGYSEKFQYAFFPLYPMVIKGVNNLINNYTLSAIAVSVISAFIGLQFLYRLISIDFSKKLAEKVITLMLFFPTAFYLITAYSESLFFLLVILSFYFLRGRKLFWASFFATLASATRPMGIAVVISLIVETYLTVGITKKSWFVFLSPLGFVIYCFYLFQKTSDPFYFVVAEQHWLRSLALPGLGFWETIRNIVTPGFIMKNFSSFFDLLFGIFGLGMVIRSFRFLPISFSIYGLISVALPLFTSSLVSMPRFLLPIFPIFILIALIEEKYLIFGYQLISIMLLALFSVLFINGFWIS